MKITLEGSPKELKEFLCNVCNRFWFFHHLQEKGTEDW